MRQARALGLALSVAALLCGACAAAPTPAAHKRPAVAPASLLPPSVFGYDFQWRQHVRARWPTGDHSFEAVLQKRAGALTLVGLSPLGLPGFVFCLNEARELQVSNRSGRPLPFEPAYVMADVQRVFFPFLPAVQSDFSGQRSGMLGETQIHERYRAGQLIERRFERDTPAGRERVLVRYLLPARGTDAPARAQLDNFLLRYSLTIETLQQERL